MTLHAKQGRIQTNIEHNDESSKTVLSTSICEDRYRWAIIVLVSLLTLVIGGIGGRQTVTVEARQAAEKVNKLETTYNMRLDNIDKNLVEMKMDMKTSHKETVDQLNTITRYILKNK